MAETVAVIGAGPFGLCTTKNLVEEGFDVTTFESRPYIGGIWQYNDDKHLSVQESTIFNSSKYRSAYTDFPFSGDVDDFPTWKQMLKYLNDYADHFDIRKRIILNSHVGMVRRENKKWVLEIRGTEGKVREHSFDKLVVATGSFNRPKTPHFEGIEKFEGRAVHAINFHKPETYRDQTVLVIGLHATSQDVVKCLAGQAKKVYISHRNGVLMVPKYDKDGAVFDAALTLGFLQFMMFMMTYLPNFWNWMFNKFVNDMMKSGFPNLPESWGLGNAPPVYITNPVSADAVYDCLESGFAETVRAVKQITGPKSVEFKDGRVLDNIDSIVYATGYDITAPYLPKEFNPYPVVGEQGNLYRGIFLLHPDPEVRNSLAFIAHGGIPWPGFQLFELQGIAVAQVWRGKSKLPPFEEMKDWHAGIVDWRTKLLAKNTVSESTQYPVMLRFPDHLRWLEETAGTDVLSHFGWGPKAWSFWWRDREFYNLMKSGHFSPAIWRLFETGKRKTWEHARAQIVRDNEIAKKQVVDRQAYMRRLVVSKY